jgi:hypothetical protein
MKSCGTTVPLYICIYIETPHYDYSYIFNTAIDTHIPPVLVLGPAAAVEAAVDVVHHNLLGVDLVLAVMVEACRTVVVVGEERHIAYVVEVGETKYIHRDSVEVHTVDFEIVEVYNQGCLVVVVVVADILEESVDVEVGVVENMNSSALRVFVEEAKSKYIPPTEASTESVARQVEPAAVVYCN